MGRLRVLVIDDDETVRRGMCRLLRAAGHTVFERESPIGASRVALRQNIDVVVVDINMPAMRGERLAAHFRNTRRLHEMPFVLVSGEHGDELDRLALEVDADAVVEKSAIAELPSAVARAATRGMEIILERTT